MFWYMPETIGKELDDIQLLFMPQDATAMTIVRTSIKKFFNDDAGTTGS